MTTPTREEAMQMARENGFVLTRHDKPEVLDMFHALVSAAYERGWNDCMAVFADHMICTDAGIAHGPISGRLEALRDKLADKARQTTEETDAEMALRSIASWLGVGGFNSPTVDAKVFEQKIYEGVEMAIKSHYATATEPELPWHAGRLTGCPDEDLDGTLGYTAAQMRDHYAAGVRAGAAGSQDVGADCTPNHLCKGRMVHLPVGEHCDKCGGEAMQGDKQ